MMPLVKDLKHFESMEDHFNRMKDFGEKLEI